MPPWPLNADGAGERHEAVAGVDRVVRRPYCPADARRSVTVPAWMRDRGSDGERGRPGPDAMHWGNAGGQDDPAGPGQRLGAVEDDDRYLLADPTSRVPLSVRPLRTIATPRSGSGRSSPRP